MGSESDKELWAPDHWLLTHIFFWYFCLYLNERVGYQILKQLIACSSLFCFFCFVLDYFSLPLFIAMIMKQFYVFLPLLGCEHVFCAHIALLWPQNWRQTICHSNILNSKGEQLKKLCNKKKFSVHNLLYIYISSTVLDFFNLIWLEFFCIHFKTFLSKNNFAVLSK